MSLTASRTHSSFSHHRPAYLRGSGGLHATEKKRSVRKLRSRARRWLVHSTELSLNSLCRSHTDNDNDTRSGPVTVWLSGLVSVTSAC